MNYYDGKISKSKLMGTVLRINSLIKNLEKAAIPLESVINSADDFNYALSFVGNFKLSLYARTRQVFNKLFGGSFLDMILSTSKNYNERLDYNSNLILK